MRLQSLPVRYVGMAFAVTILLGSVALVSAPSPQFTMSNKEFYADANLVNFVRPGLVISITSASIAQDGTITARVTIADPKGLALDRLGVTTPGAVSMSLIAAYIPKGKTQYVSYVTRVQGPSPVTGNSATQANADSGGTWTKNADGDYTYTFKNKAPTTFDPTVTHTIGVYGSRDLSEFDLPTNYGDATYNFVPNGSTVTVVRDVVTTATCNNCHDQLAFHGGSRRSMGLCVLCHTPQTTDPDTGNTLDMVVLAHKIHMGSSLPSVQAGKPYQIIGFNQAVSDWSTVVFPALGPQNCKACHDGSGTQSNNMFKATRVACGSCHDDVNFASGVNHVNLPQISDNQCTECHVPQGELEFDASILGAHTTATFSNQLGGLQFQLLTVANGSAGKNPVVSFSLKDSSGAYLRPSQLSSLSVVLAGPTTDYTAFTTGYVSESAVKADCASDASSCWWTFANAIPATATGTWTIGIEGRRSEIIYPGTTTQKTVQYGGKNQVINFSVDGSKIAARRTVVSVMNCNKCHTYLSLHGENRNQIEMCVLCHNPIQNDAARRTAAQMPPQSVDFPMMIHKIHSGENLGAPYIIYGFGGSVNDFSDVRYPAMGPTGAVGERRNCSMCHVNGSENLPLSAGHSDVSDPRGYLNPVGPESAACLSCHVSLAAASHALANTTRLGESCDACHSSSSDFSVSQVHAR
jgi:OmcA/MtrC family decaheme c-type cytochrome